MAATNKISADQIAYKKKVGTLEGSPVYEVGLIGGLHLIMKVGDSAPLGSGPHPAVARTLAKRRHPDIQWQDLSKSGWVDPLLYENLLPEYDAFTDRLCALASE
jgi:hypothetical protein